MDTQTKRPSRLRRLFKWMFRGLLVTLIVAVLAAGAGLYWLDRTILSTLPSDLSQYQEYRPLTVCQVYDAGGAKIDEFFIERRIWVELDGLPDHVWQAFVAAEDRRFFEHPGVDVLGVGRALIANLQSGDVSQGGSTLTQQLVKNLIVGSERSYERKIKEAWLAYRLERELSKHQILELYLNYVYLGAGNYGIQAAALDFYGVDASELTVGQVALIAGLIPAPSRYNPRRAPELARWRRAIVLGSMVDEGFIDAVDAIDYLSEDVIAVVVRPEPVTDDAAYITQTRREIRRLLGDDVPFLSGLQVHTPYQPATQATAVLAIAHAVDAVHTRQGWRIISDRRGPDGVESWIDPEAAAPQPGECFRAIVDKRRDLGALRVGVHTVSLAKLERSAPTWDRELGPAPLSTRIKPGDVLDLCMADDGTVNVDRQSWAQGAAVVLENATGRVLALVGGTQVELEGFVRATQARRQPGSSFKPYVYATALVDGRTQLDVMDDVPLSLPAGGGKLWTPKNYGGGYAGKMTLRRALARSTNTIAVRLTLESGPADVARMARTMGVETPIRNDPTIALGSSEVTPMDQAVGYSTIARLGVRAQPVYIETLLDVRGDVVGTAGSAVVVDGRELAVLPGGPGQRALPPGIAYELLDMMREVVLSGTARRAFLPDQDRIGKTGTTNDFVDAWFVGATPRYTVAVWVGTDGTLPLGDKETGGKAALPAWMTIMEVLPHEPGERFGVPDEVVLLRGEERWVGITRGRVPRAWLAWRDPGTTPLPGYRSVGQIAPPSQNAPVTNADQPVP